MRDTTAQQLRAVAPKILSGEYTKETPFVPEIVKRAIDILAILKDREWHTATEIGEQLGISSKYARDVLRVCAEPWSVDSDRGKGWRSNFYFCPVCKSVYYPDDEGDYFYHECDSCGWHWMENI